MKQIFIPILSFLVISGGCSRYLEKKPDQSLSTPSSIEELQGILDLESTNLGFPIAGELANDNIYYTNDDWNAIFEEPIKMAYIWDPETDMYKDWKFAYEKIFQANVVLQALQTIHPTSGNKAAFEITKGSALFLRAYSYYELAQIFAPPYTMESASQKLGIPLKKTPNIDEKSVRSTIAETYQQIIGDIQECIKLLPEKPEYKERPGKSAAYALLSRVYLSMRDYAKAEVYADSSLLIQSYLMDFNNPNETDLSGSFPFKKNNGEILYIAVSNFIAGNERARIDSMLINSYETNDIRKQAFFSDNGDGSFQFRGNYFGTNNTQLFVGLTTAEMWLTSAECAIRAGNKTKARNALNTLLEKRFVAGLFTPIMIDDDTELLRSVLNERRKELCCRGNIRWMDLRRLNQEQTLQKTLKRQVDGFEFELKPNDKKYTYLIPSDVIAFSNIQQNPR